MIVLFVGHKSLHRQWRSPVSLSGSVVAKRVMANHSATFDKGGYIVFFPPLFYYLGDRK